MNRLYRIAWFAALAVWTWLLLKPDPFPAIARELTLWGEIWAFLAAKGLHFSVYAAFAFTGCIIFGRLRRWAILGMILHGALSEVGQYYGDIWFETHRSGTVRDAIVDWVGIGIGLCLIASVHRPKSDFKSRNFSSGGSNGSSNSAQTLFGVVRRIASFHRLDKSSLKARARWESSKRIATPSLSSGSSEKPKATLCTPFKCFGKSAPAIEAGMNFTNGC